LADPGSAIRRCIFIGAHPGVEHVRAIVTPVSLSSSRSASANDWTNDFDALYTAWNEPGMVEAIDEVKSTRGVAHERAARADAGVQDESVQLIASSSAETIRSKPFSANCLASS